eukprot:Hpha_TRINITY_DN16147_c4_g7::TRINITY_DN16147_c4_g7_i1::g.6199::m.6199/K10297/FBXO11; F-box protein 11
MEDKDRPMVWSEWQEQKIELVRVSPVALPGTFRRVGDAIAAAKEGARVEIAGGTYHEQLVVTKTVEIVAEEGAIPEIQFRGNVVCILPGVTCLIEGLSIIQKEKSGASSAISASDCRPILRKIFTDSLEVKGTAAPLVEDCTISGSNGTGILISGAGGGRYLRNHVFDHSEWCVQIDSEGSPEFIENRIFSPRVGSEGSGTHREPQRGQGVLLIAGIRSGARCTPHFEDNFIGDAGVHCVHEPPFVPFAPGETDERCSVLIASFAKPVFVSNELGGGVNGVRVRLGAAPQLKENTLRSFDRAALVMESTASTSTVVEHNVFLRCITVAIMLNCDISLSNNDTNGPGEGIIVAPGTEARISHCQISSSQVGVRISAGAKAQITSNTLQSCSGPCLVVEGSGVVEGNTIGGAMSRAQGIVCIGYGCDAYIHDNTVNDVKRGPGISILKSANPTIRNNTINDCVEGVAVADRGRGWIDKNMVLKCDAGIVVQGKRTAPLVTENVVGMSKGHGVVVSGRSLGRFLRNKVEQSVKDGFHCSNWADPYVSENEISDSGQAGVRVTEAGRGCFVNNRLHRSLGSGIRVDGDLSEPVLRRNNIITGRGTAGFLCENGARGLFEKNVIPEATDALVASGLTTSPTVLCNVFGMAVECGAHYSAGASGLLSRNKFVGANRNAIVITGGATPEVTRNSVARTQVGILVEGGVPKIEHNRLDYCVSGVLVHGLGARPQVRVNVFEQNNGTAAVWEQQAEGVFLNNEIQGGDTGLFVGANSTPMAAGNSFRNCKEACVVVAKGAVGTVRANAFTSSACGVLVETGSGACQVTKNTMTKNIWGVRLCRGSHTAKGERDSVAGTGKAVLSGNTIRESEKADILSEEGGHALVENNDLERSPIGVWCRSEGEGLFQGNRLVGHKEVAMRVMHGANPMMVGNTVEKAPFGLEVRDEGKGVFEGNVFRAGGSRMELRVSTRGAPLFRKSVFS